MTAVICASAVAVVGWVLLAVAFLVYRDLVRDYRRLERKCDALLRKEKTDGTA
jgi:hypothetical protein